MDNMIKARFQACKNHPEKEEIFKLESLLLKAGIPYYFNVWEDLRPTPFDVYEPDRTPEDIIDWDEYNFLIELGDRVGKGLTMMSVSFNRHGDRTLLELLDMRFAEDDKEELTAEDGILYVDLKAEKALEIIQEFFK